MVEAALDDVALAVAVGVEGGWPAAAAALVGALFLLITSFRNGRLDSPGAQCGAGGGVGVRLVPSAPARPRPCGRPGHGGRAHRPDPAAAPAGGCPQPAPPSGSPPSAARRRSPP